MCKCITVHVSIYTMYLSCIKSCVYIYTSKHVSPEPRTFFERLSGINNLKIAGFFQPILVKVQHPYQCTKAWVNENVETLCCEFLLHIMTQLARLARPKITEFGTEATPNSAQRHRALTNATRALAIKESVFYKCLQFCHDIQRILLPLCLVSVLKLLTHTLELQPIYDLEGHQRT